MEALLAGAVSVVMVFLTEGLARGSFAAALKWAWGSPVSFGMTLGIAMGCCLLLCLCKRVRVFFYVLLCALCAFFGVACRYKMRYRLEPVLLTDVYQLNEALNAIRELKFSIDRKELALLCLIVIATLALSLQLRCKRRRPVCGAVGAALLLLLPGQCTFDRASLVTRNDLANFAQYEGMGYTALAVENQRRAVMNVNATEESVRAAYRAAELAAPETTARQTPNIILVLSESFADDAWLSQYLTLGHPLTPFYDSLSASCISGRLSVPKAGGGTSETEFEVLTGLESRYAINPYARGLPAMRSMASVLREKGCYASAIHWYQGVYYNRYANLKSLGFDEFCTTDTTNGSFESIGMFVSDTDHYHAALQQLERTPERDFLFLLTMQNHGGYEYDDFRVTYGAEKPFLESFSEQAERIVTNYCYLLEQSDRALEQFIHELSQLDEPTMVVFFGDHIPPLGAETLAELGVDTAAGEGHLTPYFIWSNMENQPQTIDLEAWQLGAFALARAGAGDDPFFAYVENMRLSGGETDETYELLSYDALFGQQYAYQEGGLSVGNDAFQIGGPMVLQGMETVQIADAIYIHPLLERPEQKSKLCINGQISDIPCIAADRQRFTLQAVMPSYNAAPYNQTEALSFANADELLAGSQRATVVQLPLSACDFETERQGFPVVLRSLQPVASAYATALTVEGARWAWQPVYALTQSGQYSLDEDGYVYLAVSDDFPSDAILYLIAPEGRKGGMCDNDYWGDEAVERLNAFL